jgi:predicted acyl esterase
MASFGEAWYEKQILPVQHGRGVNGYINHNTGENVSGDQTLRPSELWEKCDDYGKIMLESKLASHPYNLERKWNPDNVQVPLLTAANWGGQGLHTRGSIEGYIRAASKEKYLEVHGKEHWTHYYTEYGVNLQKEFFAHYLKGKDNGFDQRKRVQLQIREVGEKFTVRYEEDWPIPRTKWTKFYLHSESMSLSETPPESKDVISFEAMGEGLNFISAPLVEDTEITGPIASKLVISSTTKDADLFLIFRVFTPDLHEVTFLGALDPHTPIAQGWLRASHRKLDPNLSTPYTPWHTHDEEQPLKPGEPYEMDIEIVPTCIVVPKGHRIGLSIRGKDYRYLPAESGSSLAHMKAKFTGCGPFLHEDRQDRPPEIFAGKTTLHIDPQNPPYILLPVIPEEKET